MRYYYTRHPYPILLLDHEEATFTQRTGCLSSKEEIHYDKTVARISQDKRVVPLDSEKDVVFFDVKRPSETSKNREKSRKGLGRLAYVQISPRGKINLYVDESLQESEIEHVTKVLKYLIVDESGSGIELTPIKALTVRGRDKPDWLNRIILQFELPIKFTPEQRQIIISTFKKQLADAH